MSKEMSSYCKTVMYHYVRPIQNSQFPNIKGLEVEGFKRQIKYFKKNFKIIDAYQLLDAIYENKDIPQKSILLTFDDGLKDHFENVFPILKKNEIQGLFFTPSKPILEKTVLDVHKIHFILESSNQPSKLVNQIFEHISKNKEKYHLREPNEYFSDLANSNRFDSGEIIFIKRMLQREIPRELRNELCTILFRENVNETEEDFSEKLYLSFDEICEMKENGMFFGAHGHSHEWFTFMTKQELEKDLEECSNFYSKINNDQKTWIMCYPYGAYDENVISIMKKHHYKAGLTTIVGDTKVSKDNSYSLQRLDTNDFPQ